MLFSVPAQCYKGAFIMNYWGVGGENEREMLTHSVKK